MQLINMLAVNASAICNRFAPIVQVFGYVFLLIKIATPIILIVVGMIDMTKAITGKDEDAIKKAQNKLIKKAIAAVSVFLVCTIVNTLMTVIIGNTDYKECASCFNNPYSSCNVHGGGGHDF